MQNLIFGSLLVASALLAFAIAGGAATDFRAGHAQFQVEQVNPIGEVAYWMGSRASRI